MIKNGGYTMLDLAAATYKDAAAAFNTNKPIMVYDNSQVYYADTCVYDSDNDAYVLTKGGKTITIDSSNNVVSSGNIQNHLYKYRFNVSDMCVSFYSSKLYSFETNKEYQINDDDDYATCILTGDLLQSLKDLLADLPQYTCSLVSDNKSILTTSGNICVELEGVQQFMLSNYNNVLTTDSTGYSEIINLKIYEV